MRLQPLVAALLACAVAGPASPAPAAAKRSPAASSSSSDLDAFMARVIARREINRKVLDEYVLDEEERVDILAPGRVPLHRTRREYTWYVRDGMHVRSPVRFNGVPVGEDDRRGYEREWIRREIARRERRVTAEDGGGERAAVEPRFVSQAYFLDFKFEPGNYYLAGRETLEGREVLRIEYYPERMFGDAGAEGGDRRDREQELEDRVEHQMNKTALVTVWVDPAEHQIVRYIFENVWLDFLPGAWLLRVDEIRASMTMGQPFPGVWLPRDLDVRAGASLANGSFDAAYRREFFDYRLAEVETRIGPPRSGRLRADPGPAQTRHSGGALVPGAPPDGSGRLPPRAPPALAPVRLALADRQEDLRPRTDRPAEEVIAEIRVHGNASLPDDAVVGLAGVGVGQPLRAGGAEAVRRRLEASGRFESVEVRTRYRSLTRADEIALILVVHERPGVTTSREDPALPEVLSRPARRLRSKAMFLPIVSYADGYGLTYGARVSTLDLLTLDERLSVPLTWGGTRRAAIEFERLFDAGPLTRVESSVAAFSRENPRFEVRDRRVEVKGRAERVLVDRVRLELAASRSTIHFGGADDRLWTLGTSVALDSRLAPAYPSNAVLLSAGWRGLHFQSLARRVNRLEADARGYLRVAGQVVLAARAAYAGADAPLPPYERLLLGGSPGLRGFRTGRFDGDRTLVGSVELRAPLTSVLNRVKLGATAFLDAGTIWDHGSTMRDASWHRGAGGGLFLIASLVRINVDVARDLRGRGTRLHVSSGFTF